MSGSLKRERIRVRGTVQGVGFRPWVWQIARRLGIRGFVRNDAQGVLIEAWGEASLLDRFVSELGKEPPPLARIEAIERKALDGSAAPQEGDFRILASQSGEVRTAVAADAAVCPDCLAEIRDPANRRYRYPFTNCTHCGPRLSIVREIPYDRANTSMAEFPMCPACQAEYENPADRRFHAQPNACPDCGPRIWLEDGQGRRLPLEGEAVITEAARLIREGKIVAIKGIGGIHLACDAGNEAAVAELRRRKKRHHKSFALMARDAAMVARHARLEDGARAVLESPAAPILVLPAEGEALAEAINPGQDSLGFMLPYTPLHHLLMAELTRPMVLTSGNRSDEPQCIRNQEARDRLAGIADCLLLHDREILTRLDDSVIHLAAGRPRLLRRARGHAPEPLALPPGFSRTPRVLAMGGELKNTFCLLGEGQAVLSQHLGDLENALTYREYREMLEHYRKLFEFAPECIAVDMHPDYLSTQHGERLAREWNLPLVNVQHHHAHMAACMAEHGLPADTGPVLGLILDGLGYGEDSSLWGGEFLLGDYRKFRRLAHFAPVPMPGGAMAMYEPWRNTYAHLHLALGWDRVVEEYDHLEVIEHLRRKPLAVLSKMLEKGINSPPASSAGRLFDAVAATLGPCRDRAGFEGQAAMELEVLARKARCDSRAYPIQQHGCQLSWQALWIQILDDLSRNTDPAIMAMRFHCGLANGLGRIAVELCERENVNTLVLGGGVFQNRLLLELLLEFFESTPINILAPEKLPANDGGLAYGQAIIAGKNKGNSDFA